MAVTGSSVLAAAELKGRLGQAPGAVVLGGDYQGLGIVRSLGRRGIPVCVIDDERSIARFSRYTTAKLSAVSLRQDQTIVDALLEANRRFGLEGWILFPTRDEMVAAISRNRSILGKVFRVPTPEWRTVRWVLDKRNTYRFANELGIPTPRTWYPSSIADLEQIETSPPWVIKPAIKQHFFYATKAKAWRADNRDELRRLFQRAAPYRNTSGVMVQDQIPGGGGQQFAYCAFFKGGRSLASMVVRRRRQHPLEFGRASTFVETIESPPLEELSERFLRAIDYYGLVEIEYKLDHRDGDYKLLDVNGRTWGYHSLGLPAGVDFPYLLYADQIGESLPPCRGTPGVTWVRLLTDLPTGILEILHGEQTPREYLHSVCHSNVEAVFNTTDPLPGLVELGLLPYLLVKRGF